MELRWYQKEAVDAAWKSLREDNPLIVLPTGSGKSLVIAELCRRIVLKGGRVLVVAHRKELLEQNADKIAKLLPGVDVGVYSSGLKKRNTNHDVIVAGIASVYKRGVEFGVRQVMIVDEAHLIPNKSFGMYRNLIDDLCQYNQWFRVVGLTATPFRLQDGPLVDGEIFDTVCYSAPIRKLIDEGYLSNLTTKPTTQVDVSQVHLRAGEYIDKELEGAFMAGGVVEKACLELHEATQDRKSILVFGVSIAHCHAIKQCLEKLGHEPDIVTGDTEPLLRATSLQNFRDGKIRYLINRDVLTTGFDAPNVDCVAIMRASQSAGLVAQIVGRGLRIAPRKTDCLILDYGGNFYRHGAIDDPDYGMQSKSSSAGERNAKEREDETRQMMQCPQCQFEQQVGNMWCEGCNYRLSDGDFEHDAEADQNAEVLSRSGESFVVEGMTWCRWPGKNGKRDTMRLEYHTGMMRPRSVSVWMCVEHEGWARSKAMSHWSQHCRYELPETIDEALYLAGGGMLRVPTQVFCQRDGKYWQIVGLEFESDMPTIDDWREPDPQNIEEDEEIPF